jgi:alpha-glucosidase
MAGEPWWKGAVIYQIYPRSFADSDGDGVGDLPGITARLDHVAALGVDGIWLSPFFQSPMRDFGYDVADHCAVDPLFGTLADFDALLARAHALGLRVIIDQVYSHTADTHRWFAASRADRVNEYADWYVWADAKADGTPPNNWQSVFGGPAWTWDARRRQYYLHNFLSSQPDLNFHNPAVQAAQVDVARFWLDRGVDGFRLDAINFALHDALLRDNPPLPAGVGPRTRPFDFQRHVHNLSQPGVVDFLERIAALARTYPGDRFTVAEVAGPHAEPEMQRYTAGDRRLSTAYGFNFLYADRIDAALVTRTLARWPAGGEGWPAWAFSNHDAPRVASRWGGGDPDRMARLAMLLLISLRGNIFVYQGEELGLPQADVPFERLQDPEAIANWPLTLGRDGARTPMPWDAAAAFAGFSRAEPWLPIPAAHATRAVDAQEGDAGSMLHLTRRLIALRKVWPALRSGAYTALELPAPLLGFDRGSGATRLRCLFNLGDAAVANPLPDDWRVLAAVNGAVAGGDLPAFSGLIAGR